MLASGLDRHKRKTHTGGSWTSGLDPGRAFEKGESSAWDHTPHGGD